MNQANKFVSRRIPVNALALAALLVSALPLLASCESGGTTNQILLDHSGTNPNSIYRHHHG